MTNLQGYWQRHPPLKLLRLRLQQAAGYVGAIGGILANLIVPACIEFTNTPESPVTLPAIIYSLTLATLAGTLTGVIGCAILLSQHVDLGGLDTLHAARAGAVGGLVLESPVILLVLCIVME
ncbi:hypothetical protein CVT24_002596 [Panaeolus cyanescens]|uniref:Uncharacterized protein n=1 Tax=Panaeolus cyanescens TaxID=181874 RepID=A0A409WB12_9AGAR|nr:hypothetical protein CVT24_002596 [Panaeolus cyanescens]